MALASTEASATAAYAGCSSKLLSAREGELIIIFSQSRAWLAACLGPAGRAMKFNEASPRAANWSMQARHKDPALLLLQRVR